jgi:hypothetical protein
LLAISVRDDRATLVQLDPVTLRRLDTRGIPLANGQVLRAFSPDASKLVLATARGLRFVSVNPFRLLGRTPFGPTVKAIGWATARRLVVFQHGALVTLDPDGPRVRTSVIRLGSVHASAVYGGGLVMLGASDPLEPDGALHLTVADPAGRIRDTKLDLRAPLALGLALDARGQKAFVVGGTVVAEVDLATLQTTYHALGMRASAAHGLHSRRPHKEIPASGASFTVRWAGGGIIVVARSDWKMVRDEAGAPVTTRTPGGLWLIDTRTWSERLLEAEASNVSVVPTTGTVLAYGSSWNSKLGTTGGMGLTAFGADGSERFHRFGEAGVEVLGVQAGLAYVRDGQSVHVVDASSGRTLRSVRRPLTTQLVVAPS